MEEQGPHLRILAIPPRAALRRVRVRFCLLLLAIALFTHLCTRPPGLMAQDAPAPRILVSEVHPNPQAVPDSDGEWIELFNDGPAAVNLLGWQVRVRSGYSATLPYEVWIPPNGYFVLAQLPGALENGGVVAHDLLPGLWLEDVDALALVAPDGRVVEEVTWGEDPPVEAGRSLERTSFDGAATWAVAWQPWPGSAGDWGSPGAAWQPLPTPTPTAIPPPLQISELLADPAAVADESGEWVELFNPNPFSIDLAGWTLTNAQQSVQRLEAITAPAQGYIVLGRSTERAANGGVAVQALLQLQLANDGGSLTLRAASGALVDVATWGATLPGRSLERIGEGSAWRNGVLPWPGSAGDWGSPGMPSPPEPPTPTPTAVPPTPLPLPEAWMRPAPGANPSPIQIDEVGYRGSDEYIVLVNTSERSVFLTGWRLGDAARPGENEALAWLPNDAQVPPGGAYVVARNGVAFAARWLVAPDAQYEESDPNVSTLPRDDLYGPGHFALDDGGDEVVLLNPEGLVADALCFGKGDCAALGLAGQMDAPEGFALQRVPGPDFIQAPDMRDRWALLPADPLAPLPWPNPAPHAPVALPGGLLAWWGVLDAASTWSAGGMLPPHALLAAAAAQGLDFVALSDPAPHAPISRAPVTLLPAWGWQSEGDSAVVFSSLRPDANTWPAGLADRNALFPWLQRQGSPFLWRAGNAPALATLSGMAAQPADALTTVADATALVRSWREAGGPLLPTGSGLPLPFAVAQPAPRFTGLAAPSATVDALSNAIAARRGWLSSVPGLWLVLTANQDQVWMGGTVAPANNLNVTMRAGDGTGAALRVTLWVDGVAVAQAEAQGGAPWTQTLPAPPGAFFYATAMRADGAFAVTAPIYVAQPNPETARAAIRIAAALPRPASDWNGDGAANADDEFIRLINQGAQPVALAGWQLFDSHTADAATARFTFGSAHLIPAQGELLLWRSETHIVLNDDADHLYLFLPGGGLADEARWEGAEADVLYERRSAAIQLTPAQLQDAGAQAAAGVASIQENGPPPEDSTASDPAPVFAGAVRSSGIAPAALEHAPGASAADAVATARARGIGVGATVRGVVILPPDLLHSTLYIAQVNEGGGCGPGLRLFLPTGNFPPLAPGDEVTARGTLTTFRGERELLLVLSGDVSRIAAGALPQPIATGPAAIGEALEGRLVTFSGRIAWADGDSLYLADPDQPEAPPVRVLVARSLGWPRPAALPGQQWRVTGVVSQMARAAPWNGGYRVLVRWPADLELLSP